MDNPCRWRDISRFRADVGRLVCAGFAVGGPDGEACPRRHGRCGDDEEMYLGLCYKRCDILTDGEYPPCAAVATCCKTESLLSCVIHSKTRPRFDHGGEGSSGPHAPVALQVV
jgi:hypothetical protein